MVWWIRVGLEDEKKEKAGYRNGTPEKETDEVALGRRKGEETEDGWQMKLPRTPIKVGGS